jgi:hypothetical protein
LPATPTQVSGNRTEKSPPLKAMRAASSRVLSHWQSANRPARAILDDGAGAAFFFIKR